MTGFTDDPEMLARIEAEKLQDELADDGLYDDIAGLCEAHPSLDRNHEVTTIVSPDATAKVLKSAPPELVAGLVLHSLDLWDAALLQVTQ